eukprot:scaffold5093_cov83-Skeletonema_marinoi.AAC.2
MMPSQSPSPSGGTAGDTELPPLPNLPPNKRTISLPNNNMMPNSYLTTASEGDWLQKLQLEQNNGNGMLSSNMGMPNNNFRGDAAKYGFGGDNNSTAAGMANNSGNSASASAEGGGATSSSEREQMVAELRKMQAENEDLIRLISSRQQQQQQQLGGSGGSGGGS